MNTAAGRKKRRQARRDPELEIMVSQLRVLEKANRREAGPARAWLDDVATRLGWLADRIESGEIDA